MVVVVEHSIARPDDANTPTAAHFTLPDDSDPPRTPTRLSHTPSLSEKRPLPDDDPSSAGAPEQSAPDSSPTPKRPQPQPQQQQSGDADLKMDQDEDNHGGDHDASDNENQDEEGRPAKKKRSQRFFCTDFPPCNLSFTRSEHLARHIRKHTGERPFQCHCQRRFSRLDNLRQHAQTVHVNEDIPVDSPAATSTRFQKQVRAERIRPAGHRPRTSTLSAPSTHSRGHSRNLSGSSIGSVSDFGSPDDPRRRPPTLAMPPSTPRPMHSADPYGTQPPPAPYYAYSPSGYSTPSTYSAADPASPRMASGLASPIALVPRTNIGWGGHNSSRRLSIPSGPNPYQPPPHFAVPPSAPFVAHPGYAPPPQYPPGAPVYPPPPHFGHSRHESFESAEADWRRRSWHISTRSNIETRPATSGLTYTQRPDDPQPVSAAQPAAQQAVRLPGIDSFDRPQAIPRSRRMTNDMDIDDNSTIGDEGSSKRDSWSSMHQNLNQLELAQNTPPKEGGYWRHGASASQSSTARPITAPHSGFAADAGKAREGPPVERPSTPKRQKRSEWSYEAALAEGDGGPGPAVRTSPGGSSNSDELPTPGTSAAEYRPAIVHSNGYVEGQPGGIMVDPSKPQEVHASEAQEYRPPFPHESPKSGEDTGRLDALVAVATSEDRAMSRQ